MNEHKRMIRLTFAPMMLALSVASAHAQTLITIDASAPVPAPQTGHLKLGTNTSPSGQTIGANSQYLTRDSKPWLPIMGEFHYSRYPEELWEKELLKMKAGG